MRFSDFLLVSNPTDLDFIVGYTDDQNIRINVLDLFVGQIIGGGTAGYIPVFTAANVINNSVLFQDGSNLVIGGEDSLGYTLAIGGSLLALDGAVIESSTPGSDTFRTVGEEGDSFIIPNDSDESVWTSRRIMHAPAVLTTESATLGQLNAAISTLEGDIDILLDLKVDKSSVGEPNGVASLDATGKIPLSEIPDSIIGQVEYMGTWNAFTNTPTLNPLVPEQKGHYYVVSAAGVFGGVDYQVGDWIISNGVIWEKVDNTDAVTSVFGRIGAILALEGDYQAFYPRLSQTYDNPTWINTLAFTKITGVPAFLLENQTITLSGDVTGSGKTSIASTISNNAVTDSKLRDSVGTSVIGRSASTTGDPADIQATTDGHVLLRSAGNLLFGLISGDSISSIDWSKITGTPTTLSGYGITNAYTKTESDNKFVPYTGASANVNLGSNNITANSFIKAGGTSSQFLKADGSVDTSQYVPTTRSVNAGTGLTGGGNLSSDITIAFDTTWGDNRYAYRTRQITINGVTFDLSADRTYNVGTVTSVGLSAPTGFSVSNSPVTTSGTLSLSFATGYSLPTSASQITWDTAYNNSIVSASVTGTETKLLTLTQQDGGTITASWSDFDTAPVTSVFGRLGAIIAQSGDYTTTLVTEGTNLYFTDSRARQSISLTTTGTNGPATYSNVTGVFNIPDYGSVLTGYVPYTGANQTVNLNTQQLLAGHATFTTNGSTDTLTINHTSGSGKAINVTKGGAGEGLYVNKTSGSGNAATIVGTLEATTLVKTGGTSSQFLKADGSVDSTTYQSTADKGQPNGYASLDGNGKVPLTQINDALIGNVNFQGLWNAATNTPTLVDPPSSGTKGYYYIVSTGGTFAGITFEVGDWIISNGTAWGKVDNTDAVSSVFGRTGNVVASNGDYNTSQVTESGNLYYTDARSRAALSFAAGSGAYNSGTGVITIPTNNNQITNGAGYITSAALAGYVPTSRTITINGTTQDLSANRTFNVGTVTSVTASSPLASSGGTTPNITIQQANGSQNGFLSSTDWNTFNNKTSNVGTVTSVAALTLGTSGTDLSSSVANSTTTPVITLNVPTASAANRGALSAADWTTFNSKQNALTNPVTGTGTTNYLPKFTGSTTIGNSIISESSGTISITNNNVLTSAMAIPQLRLINNATATINQRIDLGLRWEDGTYNGIGGISMVRESSTARSGRLVLSSINSSGDPNEAMTLTSGGNLILTTGTVSDNGARLQVSGAAVITSNINIHRNGSGTVGSGGYYTLYNAATTDGMLWQLNASNNIDFWGLTSNSFTASPVITLTRAGAATFSSSVRAQGDFFAANGTSTAASIRFWDANTGLYHPGSDALGFIASGAERMRITSGGSVGINNTSPVNTAWGNETDTKQLSINGTSYAVINLEGSTGRKYSMGVGDGNFYMCYDNTAARHNITVSSGGNVLIGTTSDNGAKLQVSGTATFSNTVTANDNIIMLGGEFYYGNNSSNQFARNFVSGTSGSATLNYSFWNGSSWQTVSTLNSTGAATFSSSVTAGGAVFQQYLSAIKSATYLDASRYTIQTVAGYDIAFEPATVPAMIIKTGGNVGIGTPSPAGKLEINGLTFVNNTGDSTARLLLRNSTTGANAGGLDIREIGVDASINNASNGFLSISTNNTERMRIFAGGNTHIGPTPASDNGAKLQVSGTATVSGNTTITGNLTLNGAVTRNINFFDSSNTNLNALIQYDQISSNSGQLFFGTNNAGTFSTKLTIANTGAATFSSGIATNGYTASTSYAALFNGNVGIGTNAPEATGLTVAGGGILVSLDSGAARKVLELYATSTGAKVSSTYVGASSYGSLELLTSNEPRLTITSGGNVLIGTTTDNGRKLQVAGGALFTGGNSSGASFNIVPDVTGQNGVDLNTSYFTGTGFGPLTFTVGGSERMRITSGGALQVKSGDVGEAMSVYTNISSTNWAFTIGGSANINGIGTGSSSAATIMRMNRDSGSLRSLNAAGSINASGADYAEYMYKATDDIILKGDVCGVNQNGELTNIFADSISFVVKSTNPSYVGNDIWGSNTDDKDELEIQRQKVDRIAFSGQVPCNVLGASVGDYIIPIKDEEGKISGQAVTKPTLEQYQISVGKVWKIMEDGRAWIAVKIG